MCFYIGIEDLAANALIELMQKNDQREVSFKALTRYGTAVVKILAENNEDAILLLSRERTQGFVHDCTELFDVIDVDSPDAAIALKEHVTADDLARKFCGSIPTAVLHALLDTTPLEVLFESAA